MKGLPAGFGGPASAGPPSSALLPLLLDSVDSQIGAQHLGNGDGTVVVLILLHNRWDYPAGGQTGGVQSMGQVQLFIGAPVFDIAAAGLVIPGVGRGAYLLG